MAKHSIPCSVPSCDTLSRGSENNRRYCRLHLRRVRKHGIPFGAPIKTCGSTIDSFGYRVWIINDRRVREHRLVMELALGRRLLPTEVVHHKDHNKLNNDLDNLELTDAAKHRHKHGAFQNETHKECSRCHKIKPLAEFYIRKTYKKRRPHLSWCIACDRSVYWAKPPKVHRRTTLTDERVRAMRADYAQGMNRKELGGKYGISPATVWYIVTNRTWKHVQP